VAAEKEGGEGPAILRILMASPVLRPKKRLAQHFLTHRKTIHKIVHRSGFGPSDVILEIGPGKGALTIPLAGSVSHIFAVEKDPELYAFLGEKISQAGISNITLIHGDILRLDLDAVFTSYPDKFQVIGNLPYNISSPCLEMLVAHRSRIGRAVLMFQRELASRLSATPGGKAYGAMTVLVGYYARVTPLIQVEKEAFHPKPKVDSTVLELDFNLPFPRRAGDETAFRTLVRGAFSHRRKTLINSLRIFFHGLDRERLLHMLTGCAIDPARRPETLDMDEYLCLADKLSLTNALGNAKNSRFD
jgi:16S rRNA (adenine1518-N6/adenine1519-N6)-dimethyltransferase